MKRALVLLSLAAGTLAGCASAPRAAADGDLRASLYAGTLAPRVRLTEPAYVAIFDVRPGAGSATLVYPEPGAEQVPLRRGTQTLSRAQAGYHAWQATTSSSGATAVLYMVASREPLNLEGFATTRDARGAVAADTPWGGGLQTIIDALAGAVVTDPSDAGWTDYVLGSRSGGTRAGTRAAFNPDVPLPVSASCGNGQVVSRTGDRSAITNCPAQP